MASKLTEISTPTAPSPFPQFSQAIKCNGFLFCSGNTGLNPGPGLSLVEGTVKDRARQTLKNIEATLVAGGSNLHNVVKVNIYLTDMQNFGLVNEAYDEFFTWTPKLARTCVAIHQLPLGTDVEMDCTAFVDES
ncbi:hypothetical protein FVEN_g75 [Fusarium venenatum]|uniref:Endoribonuclease L-PSP/chorismate mutase-like protein n=1 Tax=Fusarium venenatum TaxID=56646 RepID=UPI001DDBE9C6|nr:hypothetical protein FVEN_g75 [Fusarium venenatum]KAH6994727.1 Endoribonuclease L-PSP/chorismate mutase-like protein [Fusarium venenatum]